MALYNIEDGPATGYPNEVRPLCSSFRPYISCSYYPP